MLVLLLGGWASVRAMWWENPFAHIAGTERAVRAEPVAYLDPVPAAMTPFARYVPVPDTPSAWVAPAAVMRRGAGGGMWRPADLHLARRQTAPLPEPVTTWLPGTLAAFSLPPGRAPPAAGDTERENGQGRPAAPAPFLPPVLAVAAPGRWSLDSWAFWRQGSDAAPVSQGRVPVYGASQSGAVVQYRVAPRSGHDPRLYLRAYRALVLNGESEAALGASARPLARVPLRVAGEVRYTDAAFGRVVRPAAYAVTELSPLRMPFGTRLEAYGQAGWVGGPAATWFADGQASVTGAVRPIERLSGNALRMSIGAAVWGGAQKDAQRLDVGPTLRLDMTIGKVPARVSIDWRQKVAGDASPESGVAATVSTQF